MCFQPKVDDCVQITGKIGNVTNDVSILSACVPLILTKYYRNKLQQNLDSNKKHILIFDCDDLFQSVKVDKNIFDKNNKRNDRLSDFRYSYHFMDDITYSTHNRLYYIDHRKLSLLKFCVEHFNVIFSMNDQRIRSLRYHYNVFEKADHSDHQLFFYYLNEHILKTQCNGNRIAGFIGSLTYSPMASYIFCPPDCNRKNWQGVRGSQCYHSLWYLMCQQVRLLSDYKYELLMFYSGDAWPWSAVRRGYNVKSGVVEKLSTNVLTTHPIGHTQYSFSKKVGKIKPIKDTLLIYKYFYDFKAFHSIWHENLSFRMYDDKYNINFKHLQNLVKRFTDNAIYLKIDDIEKSLESLKANKYKHKLLFDGSYWFASEKDDFVEKLANKFGIGTDGFRHN